MRYTREQGLPYPQPWEFVANLFATTNKTNGVYVEVGAHNGLTISNTAHFDINLGWSGICIEPNPTAFAQLTQNRPTATCVHAAISDDCGNGQITFNLVEGKAEMLSCISDRATDNHLARINREINQYGGSLTPITVDCLTLAEIFENTNTTHVDYLSIDTEGNELGVVKSIDFNKVNIDIISAENNEPANSATRDYLLTKGYHLIAVICGDEIYRKK
jgi:FkbM family methyltransferase